MWWKGDQEVKGRRRRMANSGGRNTGSGAEERRQHDASNRSALSASAGKERADRYGEWQWGSIFVSERKASRY
jgi:hypothetical protein